MITNTIPWRNVLMDQRGSINLPKPIKAELKLVPGSGVSVAVHQGMLLLVPAILDDVLLTDMAVAKLGIPPPPAPAAVAAPPQPVPAAAPFQGWSHQDILKFDNRCRMTLDAPMRERLGIHPSSLVLTDVRIDYDGAPVMIIRSLTPSVTLQAINDCRSLQAREQALVKGKADLAEAQEELESDRDDLDRREEELNARSRAWHSRSTPAPAPTPPPASSFPPGWIHPTPPATPPVPGTPIPFPTASPSAATYCSVCNEPQLNTPSGLTCPNGHGGVTGVEKASPGFLWHNGHLVDDISDGDGKTS